MDTSLSFKINSAITLVFVLCCALFVFVDYRNKSSALHRELARELHVTAHRLQISLKNPLWEFNDKAIDEIVSAEMESTNVQAIFVREATRDSIISGKEKNSQNEVVTLLAPPQTSATSYTETLLISQDNRIIGDVTVILTEHFSHQQLTENLQGFIFKMVILCAIEILIVILVVRTLILSRINNLKRDFSEIENGNLDQPVSDNSEDELGSLAQGLDKLRCGIKNRIHDLNHEIEVRRQAEETLEEYAQRLAIHVEETPLGVIEWNLDFEVTQWNQAAEKIFGYTREEAVGMHAIGFIVPLAIQEEIEAVWQDLLATRGGTRSENENITKDGRRVTCEWYNTTLIDRQGVVIGVASLVLDITERKKAEQEKANLESQLRQAHKMEAIGTLAGGIAHDFNNILAAILGYADLALVTMPENDPVKAHLKEIIRAGIRAKNLVRQILSFSRKEVEQRVVVELYPVVKEILKLLRASIPATIEIKQNLDKNCGSILAEPTQIHQVLLNLCTNAAQAMEEGGGVLEIDLSVVELEEPDPVRAANAQPGTFVRLRVRDQGTGIEGRYLDRIFDPYFTTKDVGKGSGMGLAVVRGIVNSHDGMITVDSQVGEGATFDVYFPRVTAQPRTESGTSDTLPTGRETILVVDDEEIIANLTKLRAEHLGYRVTATNSSVEALRVFRSQPEKFDLVITDQTMPEMTGEELAKKLLETREDIPIILCTGYSSRIDAQKAESMGIRGFIMKPVDNTDLAETIRKVLDKRQN